MPPLIPGTAVDYLNSNREVTRMHPSIELVLRGRGPRPEAIMLQPKPVAATVCGLFSGASRRHGRNVIPIAVRERAKARRLRCHLPACGFREGGQREDTRGPNAPPWRSTFEREGTVRRTVGAGSAPSTPSRVGGRRPVKRRWPGNRQRGMIARACPNRFRTSRPTTI